MLNEDIFEIFKGHGVVVVDVVGDHEVESILLMGWFVLVDTQVKIGDHAGGFD